MPMSDNETLVAFAFVVLGLLGAGAWYVIRLLNSPDGERYSRMGIQGPFVPLDEERPADNPQHTEAASK